MSHKIVHLFIYQPYLTHWALPRDKLTFIWVLSPCLLIPITGLFFPDQRTHFAIPESEQFCAQRKAYILVNLSQPSGANVE